MSKITGNGPVVKSTTPTIEQQEVTTKTKADPKVSSGEVTDKIGDIPGAGQTHAASELPPEAIITSLESLAASLEASSGGRVADPGDVDISIKPDAILNDGFISNTLTASGALVNQDQGALANTMLQSLQSSLQTTQRSSYPQTFSKGSYEPGKVIPKQFQWSDGVSGSGSSITLNPSTEDRLTSFAEGTLPQDPMAFVQFVLRESYLETTNCLMDHANKVRFFNDLKKEIRSKMQGIRDVLAENAGKGDDDVIGNTPTYTANMTYYGQTGGSNMTRDTGSGTGSGAQPQPTQAEINAANANYQAAVAGNEKTTKFNHTNYSNKINYEDSDDYGKFDDHGKATGKHAVGTHVEKMTPEQQEALLKHYKANGLHVELKVSETDWYNDDYDTPDDEKSYPTGKESLADFVERAVKEQAEKFKSYVKEKEGNIAITHMTTEINWAEVTVTEKIKTDAQLAADHPDSTEAQSAAPSLGATGSNWVAGEPATTKAQHENALEDYETQLNTVGDDGQLANVDLQNWLQKQQQTMQMMSNISKLLHDTAMAVIRKIG